MSVQMSILTNGFFSDFDHFTGKIATNNRSRFCCTEMKRFPIGRILSDMGYFDQKILESTVGKLQIYRYVCLKVK